MPNASPEPPPSSQPSESIRDIEPHVSDDDQPVYPLPRRHSSYNHHMIEQHALTLPRRRSSNTNTIRWQTDFVDPEADHQPKANTLPRRLPSERARPVSWYASTNSEHQAAFATAGYGYTYGSSGSSPRSTSFTQWNEASPPTKNSQQSLKNACGSSQPAAKREESVMFLHMLIGKSGATKLMHKATFRKVCQIADETKTTIQVVKSFTPEWFVDTDRNGGAELKLQRRSSALPGASESKDRETTRKVNTLDRGGSASAVSVSNDFRILTIRGTLTALQLATSRTLHLLREAHTPKNFIETAFKSLSLASTSGSDASQEISNTQSVSAHFFVPRNTVRLEELREELNLKIAKDGLDEKGFCVEVSELRSYVKDGDAKLLVMRGGGRMVAQLLAHTMSVISGKHV
ncbi:hypothetical protein HK102_009283 [Quaeritorhiza haematococci]|nr:hypothetical protein HK102_009283 [Quaeritorhiza haematococci]